MVTVRGIASVLVTAGTGAVLTMAYVVLAGRMLGPDEYSDFGAALSLIYLAGLALSPLSPAASRLSAIYVANGDLSAVASMRRQILMLFGAGVALPVGLLCLAAAPIAAALQFRAAASLVCALFVALLYAIVSIDRGVIQGFLLFSVHNENVLIETGVRLASGVLLLLLWRRSAPVALLAYVIAMLAAESVLAVRLARMIPPQSRVTVDWNAVRRMTVPIAIMMTAVAIFQNTDVLIVKRYFPANVAGQYAAAGNLARSIGVLFAPLYVVISPVLARLHEEGRSIVAATLRLTATFIAISSVAIVVIVIWPREIVRLLYGPAFVAAAPLLAPLAGLMVISYTALMLAQALITIGRTAFLAPLTVLAIAQIVALVRFHVTMRDVFTSLYACQVTALLVIAFMFLISRKTRTAL
jgi:O-antigen/teichoic acid export membrane protein